MIKMYSYTKKKSHKKAAVIGAMSLILAVAAAGISYLLVPHEEAGTDTPVSIEAVNVPVITLPAQSEKAKRPYGVEATVVLGFYDGEESEVPTMTKFEGTYRGNQGIDYAFNKEAFDVTAILSGEVVEIKDDPLFGHSCTIKSGDLLITYQSLKDVRFQEKDQVKQGDAISLASTNIYNKDLGNHVHIVVEKGGQFINPESIYDKSLQEIK